MNTKKLIPKIFYSKLFFLGLLIVLGFMGTKEYQKWQQRRAVDQEIAALQAQDKELQEQNQQLQQSIEFLSSEQYQEKLARLQLNLKKEGEIVVNFPPEPGRQGPENSPNTSPNPIKWWEYIFIN